MLICINSWTKIQILFSIINKNLHFFLQKSPPLELEKDFTGKMIPGIMAKHTDAEGT